jgi:hypothetical protein
LKRREILWSNLQKSNCISSAKYSMRPVAAPAKSRSPRSGRVEMAVGYFFYFGEGRKKKERDDKMRTDRR